MRRVLLAGFLLLGPGITPSHGLTFTVGAMADDLPVPPIPPQQDVLAEIAPVPNADARAPVVEEAEAPTFDVRLYRAKLHDPSQGFAPGSRYQDTEDRKPIQTPGLSISVPLK
jgi:hypothetical protein